ncbi:MAG: hypothetical protein ABIY70_26070 [Capsulimonas sp.]|uniref:hypothetical protein n=1 Tax=Capsulimonas sp. TaxID=2494211 RepID=UPI0032633816
MTPISQPPFADAESKKTDARVSSRVQTLLDELLSQPCPFEPSKQVRQTHVVFRGVDLLEVNGKERSDLSIAWLTQNQPDLFSNTYHRDLYTQDFTKREIDAQSCYLVYLGPLGQDQATNYEDQVALLPHHYRSAYAVEAVMALAAYKNRNECFPSGKFRWGWCSESLDAEQATHIAVSVAGCSTLKFDELPNERVRANRGIVAVRTYSA